MHLAAFVSDPLVEMWVAYARGWPRGFFMLDWREHGVCDLAYFGWCPRRWAGSGGALLRAAIAKGWGRAGVAKMTVNTCTLDHPRALGPLPEDGLRPRRHRRPHPCPCRDRDTSLHPA
jgi:hypothetical protein